MNKRVKTNSIRIISGRWRGRRLPVLDHDGLRPTTDRVRETLFNWLMHDVPAARCLDLFAGSGVLGLECLSRSAKYVQFVESERRVADQLRQNLTKLDAADAATVSTGDALNFLRAPNHECFDLVFLDPPFQAHLLQPAIDLLNQPGWLSDGAMVYIEHHAHDDSIVIPENWVLHRSGKAGQSRYHLYRH
ncbi:16S rRNA (guanine(966)-N(2))-methyltransferase RsmD [Arenicella xantha]|uniref:Ribosomal RNA small subunit methyltransferase D n=1 Tax=Arenicella xantha TaxID=644221 RepID=A0A395JP80_9GAMM|nr:16S rRNA (guanine(966)-N(2))-methyltransferase RsmD [Arenicella xantha]RBP53419.1 16S rRNA m(2)G-966 methyltransferase [Arenicella xantha]